MIVYLFTRFEKIESRYRPQLLGLDRFGIKLSSLRVGTELLIMLMILVQICQICIFLYLIV